MFTVIKTRKEDEGEEDEEEAPNRKPKPKQVGRKRMGVLLGRQEVDKHVEEEDDENDEGDPKATSPCASSRSDARQYRCYATPFRSWVWSSCCRTSG